MTKCQKFLTGKKIKQVEHLPKELILHLEDGTLFKISILYTQSEYADWGNYESSLNFEFVEQSRED